MKDDNSKRRNAFRRRTTWTLFALFCVLSSWFTTAWYEEASAIGKSHTVFGLILAIPLGLMLLLFISAWITNKIAALIFGKVEIEEQSEKTKEIREKIKKLTETEGYKRRAYEKKIRASLMLLFIVIFFPLAILIRVHFHVSELLTANVAFFISLLVPAYIARIKTDQKFGKDKES